MTSGSPGDLEQRLQSLREQQAELAAAGTDKARLRDVGREIASVAGRLGFDADEAGAIADQIDAPASGSRHAMAGEYRVLRGSADPILTFSALVIAAAVIGLGRPVTGAAIIVAALGSWFIRGALRVARLHIDASGALGFPGRIERISPSELIGIDFAYRYPFAAAEHEKAASETVELRLHLSGERSIKLARGPLWRLSPRREPVAYSQLERRLLAQAREAGLTVERNTVGWRARRQ